MAQIKKANKERLAAYIKKANNVIVNRPYLTFK